MDEEAEMMARREEDLAGKLEGENVKVKILLNRAVHYFGLAIRLRMVCHTHAQRCAT